MTELPVRDPTPAERIAPVIALGALFAAPALLCLKRASTDDPDLWWHLRTGQWILQQHAVPRTDPFSALAGKVWPAYSWLFELLTFSIWQHLGPVGIVCFTTAMTVAITVALRHLVHRLQSDFSLTALITFAACFSMLPIDTPRPWLFTILFFVLELDILMHARKTGKAVELAWLPLIFALWSNVHVQFIDGLAVLGLAAAESLLARVGVGSGSRLRPRWICAAAAGSLLATFANPFGVRIYQVAYDLASQPGVLNKITELQATSFRDSIQFCFLGLTLAAAVALGSRRRFELFETGLLVLAAVVSFRSRRDVWVMSIAAAAIIASSLAGRSRQQARVPRFTVPAAVLLAAMVLAAGFRLMHVNRQKLEGQVASIYPVKAVEEIRAKGYPGPLYNDFSWGGYLIWALRMPVSIDGRAAFYGDQAIDRSVATWGGAPDWAEDPALRTAGIVLGPANSALVQLLRTDPRFRLAYEDKQAVVFVARR